jgi:methylated-DNA-[protein]-cysteine S-methyltransferase
MRTTRIISSPVGPLHAVAENGMLVALSFGDPGGVAPSETTAHDEPVLRETERQLGQYFAKERRAFDLPVTLRGSNLELAVWEAMRRIPFGFTRRYGELADELGAIARNVGTACGRNPIPIIVPCHRIVGAAGRLTGFSGGQGIETKAWLLRHELATPMSDQLSLFAGPRS